MKIRKGDVVQVLSGKDLGKTGTVSRVLPEAGRVIVDGVNMARKHQKPTSATRQGGIIDKDLPIDISNVALVCPKCGPTRIGYRMNTDKNRTPDERRRSKERVCEKCGGTL
jgi:large subunit ribosomal protein L24